MSIAPTPLYSQADDVDQSLAQDEYHDEGLYLDAVNEERQLWDLQRELSAAKLALQAEIWDLRAEVQTLRLDALRTAGDLEKIVGRILTGNERNPHDPTC